MEGDGRGMGKRGGYGRGWEREVGMEEVGEGWEREEGMERDGRERRVWRGMRVAVKEGGEGVSGGREEGSKMENIRYHACMYIHNMYNTVYMCR